MFEGVAYCPKTWVKTSEILSHRPSSLFQGQLSPPSMVQSYWTSQNEAADTQKYNFCNFCTLILIHLNVVFIPKLQELCPKSLAPHGGAARKRRGGSCTAQRRGEAGDDGGWSWKKGWDTLQGTNISPQKLAFWRWFSFSQGGICIHSLEGNFFSIQKHPKALRRCSWKPRLPHYSGGWMLPVLLGMNNFVSLLPMIM